MSSAFQLKHDIEHDKAFMFCFRLKDTSSAQALNKAAVKAKEIYMGLQILSDPNFNHACAKERLRGCYQVSKVRTSLWLSTACCI